MRVPLIINNQSIDSIDDKKGHRHLGMIFVPTNDIKRILNKNLNARMINITKFYAWLDVNVNTPIDVKMMVFDNCVLNALLYGIETWGDISCIEKQLKVIETKALKCILRVKKGTTNDLIYHELRRGDIICKIKDRQYSFYKKLSSMPENNAVVQNIMQICEHSRFLSYYKELHNDNFVNDIKKRQENIKTSTNSMTKYYATMNFVNKNDIYTSYLCDHYRYIITRWRLSCHDLKIETGRYAKPTIPREM